MQQINTVELMQKWVLEHSSHPIAAVYTMGALHQGHSHLMTFAREWILRELDQECFVVASIFVNPTQFTNSQDLEKYPRTLDADSLICEAAGVDALFVPTTGQMYPEGIENTVLLDAGPLKNKYEGLSRPGHFGGVVTVVNKLFMATKPQFAFFGEKDYQQLTVLRQFVENQHLDIKIVGVPTVRDENGIALSSRNSRLSDDGRTLAHHLPTALDIVSQAVGSGVEVALAISSAKDYLETFSEIELDYLVVTDPNMETVPSSGPARVLIAATIDGVRLLDNKPIQIGRA